MNNARMALIVLIAIVFGTTACTKQTENDIYEETQIKMGTPMTIKAYGTDSKSAVNEAFRRIDEIEQLTSLNIDSSEVNKINRAAGRQYVSVHHEVVVMIKKSIEYSKLSGGAFDITVGPIVQLWKLGTSEARVPDNNEIIDKLPLVGYEKIRLNEDTNSVMLEKEGMIIDLGGIAKGYAADEVNNILAKHGVKRALVNIGSSTINVIGQKDNNKPWTVGLRHPRKEIGQGFLGIVKESDKSISTSGDYERFIIVEGKRYHHVLNPKTGYPAESGVVSDTLIVDNALPYSSMSADALSTSVFVLGPEKGMELIKSISGIDGIIVMSDSRLVITPGVKGKVESISEDYKL